MTEPLRQAKEELRELMFKRFGNIPDTRDFERDIQALLDRATVEARCEEWETLIMATSSALAEGADGITVKGIIRLAHDRIATLKAEDKENP